VRLALAPASLTHRIASIRAVPRGCALGSYDAYVCVPLCRGGFSTLALLVFAVLSGCGGAGTRTVYALPPKQQAALAKLAVEAVKPVCKPGRPLVITIERQRPTRRSISTCVSPRVAAEVERIAFHRHGGR